MSVSNVYRFPRAKAELLSRQNKNRGAARSFAGAIRNAIRRLIIETGWAAFKTILTVVLVSVRLGQFGFGVLTLALLGKLYLHWGHADAGSVALQCLGSFALYCLLAGITAMAQAARMSQVR